MSGIGPSFKPEVFRNNSPVVIATNRNTAILLPIVLRYDEDGYQAGQVIAQNSTDKLFQKYNPSGASGTDTAVCVLGEPIYPEDFSAATSQGACSAAGIFGGVVLYEDRLTGLDANAKVDLGARSIVDASGINLLKF